MIRAVMTMSVSNSCVHPMGQYINTFIDLVDNLPNAISRHLSQLHHLHNNYLKLMNRMSTNVDNYNELMATMTRMTNTAGCDNMDNMLPLVEKRKQLSRKIEIQLIQMQELSDEKLKYSQLIIDLIETKGKELDLDFEELSHLNEKSDLINSSEDNTDKSITRADPTIGRNYNNINNGSENQIMKETNEEKRLLPRRACALKSGQNGQIVDLVLKSGRQKVMSTKGQTTKAYSKCHNFGLSMSNFYRDMARRRAKLPKVSQISKIGLKMKEKKSVPSTRRTLNSKSNTRSNRQSMKPLITAKQTVGSNSEIDKNGNQSSICWSSSSDESSVSQMNTNIVNNNNNSVSKRLTNNDSSKRRNKSKSRNNGISNDLFIGEPVDPNEPTYCLCDQVSYGEMICCDNQLCRIEWFHFPCVDLVHKPKGKWFCPLCSKSKANPKTKPKGVDKQERHNVPKSK